MQYIPRMSECICVMLVSLQQIPALNACMSSRQAGAPGIERSRRGASCFATRQEAQGAVLAGAQAAGFRGLPARQLTTRTWPVRL